MKTVGVCSVDGCERKRVCRSLCQTHYSRFIRGQSDWSRPIKEKYKNSPVKNAKSVIVISMPQPRGFAMPTTQEIEKGKIYMTHQ